MGTLQGLGTHKGQAGPQARKRLLHKKSCEQSHKPFLASGAGRAAFLRNTPTPAKLVLPGRSSDSGATPVQGSGAAWRQQLSPFLSALH